MLEKHHECSECLAIVLKCLRWWFYDDIKGVAKVQKILFSKEFKGSHCFFQVVVCVFCRWLFLDVANIYDLKSESSCHHLQLFWHALERNCFFAEYYSAFPDVGAAQLFFLLVLRGKDRRGVSFADQEILGFNCRFFLWREMCQQEASPKFFPRVSNT